MSARDYMVDQGEEQGGAASGIEVPMRCADCQRPAYYDCTDERYHHALRPAEGCFLIGPEPGRKNDPEHPLMKAAQ
jgi:hypothetical protein